MYLIHQDARAVFLLCCFGCVYGLMYQWHSLSSKLSMKKVGGYKDISNAFFKWTPYVTTLLAFSFVGYGESKVPYYSIVSLAVYVVGAMFIMRVIISMAWFFVQLFLLKDNFLTVARQEIFQNFCIVSIIIVILAMNLIYTNYWSIFNEVFFGLGLVICIILIFFIFNIQLNHFVDYHFALFRIQSNIHFLAYIFPEIKSILMQWHSFETDDEIAKKILTETIGFDLEDIKKIKAVLHDDDAFL